MTHHGNVAPSEGSSLEPARTPRDGASRISDSVQPRPIAVTLEGGDDLGDWAQIGGDERARELAGRS